MFLPIFGGAFSTSFKAKSKDGDIVSIHFFVKLLVIKYEIHVSAASRVSFCLRIIDKLVTETPERISIDDLPIILTTPDHRQSWTRL